MTVPGIRHRDLPKAERARLIGVIYDELAKAGDEDWLITLSREDAAKEIGRRILDADLKTVMREIDNAPNSVGRGA